MIDFFKYKLNILPNQEIAVVGVYNDGKKEIYNYIKLIKDNEELQIIERRYNLHSLDDIIELSTNLPIVLTFMGKGILYSSDNDNVLLNNNPDEYYTYKYINNDDQAFTSLTRRDTIDHFIEEFRKAKCNIINVIIGPFITSVLYKRVFDQKTIVINDIVLLYNSDDCINFKKSLSETKESVLVDNEQVPTSELYLFSAGFEYFYPSDKVISIELKEEFDSERNDKKYTKQSEIIIKIGVILFLFLIVLNYLVGYYYTNKSNEKNSSLSVVQENQLFLNMLNEEKNRKTKILNESGFFNTNSISFYINEIGQSVPTEISLTLLDILPLKAKITQNKKIEFNYKEIIIGGISNNTISFDNWLKKLRKFNWLTHIDILEYKQQKNKAIKFQFKIILK